jgi:hypothetical protein
MAVSTGGFLAGFAAGLLTQTIKPAIIPFLVMSSLMMFNINEIEKFASTRQINDSGFLLHHLLPFCFYFALYSLGVFLGYYCPTSFASV